MSLQFNEKLYLQSKLAQCEATGQRDAGGNHYTLSSLKAAIEEAGYTVQKHYQKFSSVEGTKGYTQTNFDEDYYLHSKLAQLASHGQTDWTKATLIQAINKAGMTVEEHFQKYSTLEGTSANPFFNTIEYLEAKLKQLQNSSNTIEKAEWADKTVEDVAYAIKKAGMSAEEHYMRCGAKETDADGYFINPSNAFDANAYAAAKLAELQKTDFSHWSGKTAQDVMNAITKTGLSPVSHYERYGFFEAEKACVDMVQTVPVIDRVANDELRDATSENVPANYNASTPAPQSVSKGVSVTKPCDVSQMSESDKPANPVLTPSDVDYFPIPGGGIKDTNNAPVIIVTASTVDANGNEVRVAQYGVSNASGTEVTGVTPAGAVTSTIIQSEVTNESYTTVTSEVQQRSTVIKEVEHTTEDGVTRTTTAVLNGGAYTVSQNATTSVDAKGDTATITLTKVKNADGEVIMTQFADKTTTPSSTSSSTDYTTIKYNPSTGAMVGSETGTKNESIRTDGIVTYETEATLKDANDKIIGFLTSKEIISKDKGGNTVINSSVIEKDANGIIINEVNTITINKMDNGVHTSKKEGTVTDADNNVTSVNETTTSSSSTSGVVTKIKVIDNTTVNSDGKTIGTEAGSIVLTIQADGSAEKVTSITITDEKGKTTTVNANASYDHEKGITTTHTETTTDGSTTKEDTIIKGDAASDTKTPCEEAQQAEDSWNDLLIGSSLNDDETPLADEANAHATSLNAAFVSFGERSFSASSRGKSITLSDDGIDSLTDTDVAVSLVATSDPWKLVKMKQNDVVTDLKAAGDSFSGKNLETSGETASGVGCTAAKETNFVMNTVDSCDIFVFDGLCISSILESNSGEKTEEIGMPAYSKTETMSSLPIFDCFTNNDGIQQVSQNNKFNCNWEQSDFQNITTGKFAFLLSNDSNVKNENTITIVAVKEDLLKNLSASDRMLNINLEKIADCLSGNANDIYWPSINIDTKQSTTNLDILTDSSSFIGTTTAIIFCNVNQEELLQACLEIHITGDTLYNNECSWLIQTDAT